MTVTHRKQSSRRPARHAAAGTAPSERAAPPSSGHAATGPTTADRSDEPRVPARRRPDGAWRDGDPVGGRQFVLIGDMELERGGVLPDVRIAYETWGRLNDAGDNVVLVEHALTGDSHVVGEAGPGHASPGLVELPDRRGRPGRPRRVVRHRVQRPRRLPGQHRPVDPAPDGRPWGSRFPYVTVRDQVTAERLLLDHLGIRRVAAVVGGSMGGMRAIEWAVTHPDDVDRCIVLASTPAPPPTRSPGASRSCWPSARSRLRGGDYYTSDRRPDTGLGIARRIAHITYRTESELDERFGRSAQLGEDPLRAGDRGRFAVESYLDHHAGKLARRFDANSYVVLTEAMNSHDVGRDRGGLQAALGRVSADCTIVSVDTDRLYPPRLSDELHAALPVLASARTSSPTSATTDSSSRRSRWAGSFEARWTRRLTRWR